MSFFFEIIFLKQQLFIQAKEKGFSENAFLEVEVGSVGTLKEGRCAAVKVFTTLKT